MKGSLSVVFSLLAPLGTALGAIDNVSHPQTWSQAGGIARLAIILFFGAVVTGLMGYSKIPQRAAKAGKVLFAICVSICIALMLAAIFIPGKPAQP